MYIKERYILNYHSEIRGLTVLCFTTYIYILQMLDGGGYQLEGEVIDWSIVSPGRLLSSLFPLQGCFRSEGRSGLLDWYPIEFCWEKYMRGLVNQIQLLSVLYQSLLKISAKLNSTDVSHALSWYNNTKLTWLLLVRNWRQDGRWRISEKKCALWIAYSTQYLLFRNRIVLIAE